MEERNLGRSGLRVSLVGLGGNNFGDRLDLEATRAVVHAALDAGITLLDTSDNYGGWRSEEMLGAILGSRRKDVVLATKFATLRDQSHRQRDASRRYIMTAVEESLRKLRTDWIDLYQLHWPDIHTPVEETLRALDDLVRSGKVRYIGCSNLPAWRVVEAHYIARDINGASFVSCQDEYSLLARGAEKELIPAVDAYGLSLLPYLPLAGGLLSGKYKPGEPPPAGTRYASAANLRPRFMTVANWTRIEALTAFATARGRSLLELAFAWLAAHREIASVIAAASTPAQVSANVAAASWRLDTDELAEVDRLSA